MLGVFGFLDELSIGSFSSEAFNNGIYFWTIEITALGNVYLDGTTPSTFSS
jgi:hypothetical protein